MPTPTKYQCKIRLNTKTVQLRPVTWRVKFQRPLMLKPWKPTKKWHATLKRYLAAVENVKVCTRFIEDVKKSRREQRRTYGGHELLHDFGILARLIRVARRLEAKL